MENNVLVSEGHPIQAAAASSEQHSQSTTDELESSKDMRKTSSPPGSSDSPPQPPRLVPSTVVAQLSEIIDTYSLTKEQLIQMYDDHIAQKLEVADSPLTQPVVDEQPMDEEICDSVMTVCDAGAGETRGCEEEVGIVYPDSPPPLTSVVEETAVRDSSPSSAIGQKRKHFTLEEELNYKTSPFVEALIDRDQVVVGQAIKNYMTLHSIPQREVVDCTGLNQSHLSQHFLHGVTMKRAKRAKLYQWFEEDQKSRTGKVQSADGSLCAVLESPRVEGKRRPRWKWSPISTQILTEAFKKNQFPTRDQRMDLARICNEAEVAMNNGAEVRGPEGDTEGITEQRVNTWFTNRRKGLGTPITPPASKVATPATPIYTPMLHPTLLRASPATTPVLARPTHPYKTLSPQRVGLVGGPPSSDKATPTTLQSLVSQIQESQVSQGKVGMAVPIPSLLSRPPPVALPLTILSGAPHANTMIRPPSGTHHTVIGSPMSGPHTAHTPAHHPTSLHTVTMPFSLSPALITPSQVQALISQFHSPTTQVTATNMSHDKRTKSHDQEPGMPLTVQPVTLATEPTIVVQDTSSPAHHESIEGAGLTQLTGGIVLNQSQMQALMSQLQAQQKVAMGEGIQVLMPNYGTVTTE